MPTTFPRPSPSVVRGAAQDDQENYLPPCSLDDGRRRRITGRGFERVRQPGDLRISAKFACALVETRVLPHGSLSSNAGNRYAPRHPRLRYHDTLVDGLTH